MSRPPRRVRPTRLSAALMASVWAAHLATGDTSVPLVLLHGLAPWWQALALPGLLWALLRQDRGASVAWGALVVAFFGATSSVLALAAVAPPASTAGHRLKVLSANVLTPNPHRAEVIAELLARDADLLVLIEASDTWVADILTSPAVAAWPYHHAALRGDPYGLMVLSRLPLRDATVVDQQGVPWIELTVDAGGTPLHVLAVHAVPPYLTSWIGRWQAHVDTICRWRPAGPAIVVGDINAAPGHPTFRSLLACGWSDADQVNLLPSFTWPANRRYPPLMALDHVLADDEVTITSLTPVPVRGSDHRAIEVELSW